MESEIESIANSLELPTSHRRLLQLAFFYPDESTEAESKEPRDTEAKRETAEPPSPESQTMESPPTRIPSESLTPKEALAVGRWALLAEYKTKTGASNKRIYEARNSGINKPEFYAWRKGDLPETSKTTIKFKDFLLKLTPPIPKKPKH